MKINLLELKKWNDNFDKDYSLLLDNCLNNWYDNDFKKSIEYNTFFQYQFIKNDCVDLKVIELYDEHLFEITLNKFLDLLYHKHSDDLNIKIDIDKLSISTEDDIMIYNNESDYKKSVYYTSLKSFGLINNKNEISIDIMNKYPIIKKKYIQNSMSIIYAYGIDFNEIITKSLIKMNILSE